MLESSRLAGLHQMEPRARRQRVLSECGLQQHPDLGQALDSTDAAMLTIADVMVENAIGTFEVPLGVATNLIVDGAEVLVPMATEESSVIAAVCNGARQCRESGGIRTVNVGSCMIAQIQVKALAAPHAAAAQLHQHRDDIRALCNECDPTLVGLGGGFEDLQVRVLSASMLVLHIIVDTRDAMGANAVNTMAEKLAPHVEQWTGGVVGLKILSNLADRRTVRASATWSCAALGGPEVRDGIISAGEFACLDPYRATTHNKGIMNGVSAVVLATGNDTRAVESGAHAFAARSGHYSPLTRWEADAEGNLVGTLELPLAVGIVGGATRVHATAQLCLAIMQITSAAQLAGIIAAVGLVQNFSALKALATEGIQRGHMSLHAKNVAVAAGATGEDINRVAQQMIASGTINESAAKALL
ncbi:MAG: hydroxymethylglutaryl-CoA reductase, degradative [Gammaproteobacteria bacterium]|nr:hydroxymethylglutaryl-CoA reductase, degradative [Gammaproteobacteria bacterium]